MQVSGVLDKSNFHGMWVETGLEMVQLKLQ